MSCDTRDNHGKTRHKRVLTGIRRHGGGGDRLGSWGLFDGPESQHNATPFGFLGMNQPAPRLQADVLFKEAYDQQMAGNLEQALSLYSRSIEIFPTAEAYTFRGWTYSFMGDYGQAIRECERAIEVDPEYGNPYNDIGAYLIEQGKLRESITWLERATRAARYQNYCFPYFNLGRVFERLRDYARAQQCYATALQHNPKYGLARKAQCRLQALWN